MARAVVSYSVAHTVVPTYFCFNRCTYCTFRQDGALALIGADAVAAELRAARAQDVCEILVLSGEVHPRSAQRESWFKTVLNVCDQALKHGMLPHTNVGPLSWAEMDQLAHVNASMGLMLESTSPALQLKGGPHFRAPSKDVALRKQQLEQAGKLRVPFTTGLLLNIGEHRERDTRDSLQYIAQVHREYSHIQEIILQPFQPGQSSRAETSSADQRSPMTPRMSEIDAEYLFETVRLARALLPESVAIQVPANLMDLGQIVQCVELGASDLGGLGIVRDEVNPLYAFPSMSSLSNALAVRGFQLGMRLPVHKSFYSWCRSARVSELVREWHERIQQSATLLHVP
ncbi:FO synthase subunit 1 [Porphyridium purpureum]|uniref:7,8-didemethyl-8-hydroxy-5-deazariboflavin synthase n=1 Tax=Porphyridium purpureum TaxID=35688 RepID=A0A5J4YNF4_PORPP|nr:FO synthase subunit 1 [Porphyridium purpureum]|eukprot:POR2655..scf249_10